MLPDEDFKELLKKSQAGDQAATECIVENNLSLVKSVVHRFLNRGYEWDDLFQIGCIGLIKAIERFDTNYNVKFSTYAVPMIIGEIRRFIRDDNPLKVSRSVKELAYKVYRVQERLQGILGREPTLNEVAEELALAPQEIVAALEAAQPPASLYNQTFHNEGEPIHRLDQIKVDDGEDTVNLDNIALREVVARLPLKLRTIIELRFFQDKTQAEIAAQLGLSQVQISRLEKQALKLIREWLQTS